MVFVFSFESLPVLSVLRSEGASFVEQVSIKKWFDALAKTIWQSGVYRFSRRDFYRNKDGTLSAGTCRQDQADEKPASKNKIRLSRRLKRYACGSSLSFKVSLEERSLVLKLRHKHHAEYKDIRLSPEALKRRSSS